MATTPQDTGQPGQAMNGRGAPHAPGSFTPFCPAYHRAVELIGRRWSGAVVRTLLSGATRFSEMVALVPGLSDRLLSERLKELEAEGIVTRVVIPETPVRVEYGLTEKGQALGVVVEAISAWAEVWLAGPGEERERCHPDGPCAEAE